MPENSITAIAQKFIELDDCYKLGVFDDIENARIRELQRHLQFLELEFCDVIP
jgi:hypothetical protein